ncbi:MAG: hypothetical protein JEZ11_22940 [Desulfobacterales bacterium]|nr:hypothetical protein [Desulfobacterales bacterium]
MELSSIANIVAWIGGTIFTYIYVVSIGNLRDDGKGWFDALIRKNPMLLFGFMGILTLVCLMVY